ncbi:A/G-specific adenine glycosylase [Prevotella sp. 10(H)]|uniref:A/G-specific adenine glycosylase n=1 Tax=Prevotella sp. 10(H) TaxID=1158294 RepID=UPI0004A6FD41|nr:A/G-specific adenine glycosylase [Prevotella sp. 10(H)]
MSIQKDLRLSSILIKWYNDNKRDLPWRDTTDPYIIWISEIILQQTRVDQGYNYFLRFIQRFSSVDVLAKADESEVLKLWQGLGYYSRARNLHAAAKMVTDNYGGVFPYEYKNVLSLKGVGEYTAAAIVSFAYNEPYAVVDGNVYRVLSRIFAIDDPIDSTKGKKVFAGLAQELLDEKHAGLHNQAIMEFGALQCVPVSPDCENCPAASLCLAYAHDKVRLYPVKEGKQKVRNRYFNYLDIRVGDNMLLHKRTGKDIWQNLFELPLIESEKQLTIEELQKENRFKNIFGNSAKVHIKYIVEMKHILSHQIIYASFYKVTVNNIELSNNYIKVKVEEADNYPVSRLVHKYLEKM